MLSGELCGRFINANNLRKLLETNSLPSNHEAAFRARLISMDYDIPSDTALPQEAIPKSKLLESFYGAGVSQELFRKVQSNMVKDIASRLPSPDMASSFDFNEFIETIFKGRCAIVSKADPSNLANWNKRPIRTTFTTPISERYFPYYRKILDATQQSSNKDCFTLSEDTSNMSIRYKSGDDNIPLTGYSINRQWNHTQPEYISTLLGLLEKQYRDILSESPPQNEEDFQSRFLPKIAECHWLLAHTCPFTRGSAFVAEVVTRSLCFKFGRECSFGDWMPDCEALVTPNPEDFKQIFAEKTIIHKISTSLLWPVVEPLSTSDGRDLTQSFKDVMTKSRNSNTSIEGLIDTFYTSHKTMLSTEKGTSWFKKTEVQYVPKFTLEQILTHALKKDAFWRHEGNRSQKICMQLGWIERDAKGNVTLAEGAPDQIKMAFESLLQSAASKRSGSQK